MHAEPAEHAEQAVPYIYIYIYIYQQMGSLLYEYGGACGACGAGSPIYIYIYQQMGSLLYEYGGMHQTCEQPCIQHSGLRQWRQHEIQCHCGKPTVMMTLSWERSGANWTCPHRVNKYYNRRKSRMCEQQCNMNDSTEWCMHYVVRFTAAFTCPNTSNTMTLTCNPNRRICTLRMKANTQYGQFGVSCRPHLLLFQRNTALDGSKHDEPCWIPSSL